MKAPEVDFEIGIIFDIYNRIINPHDQSIDWWGFNFWINQKEIKELDFYADLMLLIRSTYNEQQTNRIKLKKELDDKSKIHNDKLRKKFGG